MRDLTPLELQAVGGGIQAMPAPPRRMDFRRLVLAIVVRLLRGRPVPVPILERRSGVNGGSPNSSPALYRGASDKGVTERSGRYPPAPITNATIEPLIAKITRSESVTTRNFNSHLRVVPEVTPQSIAQP